MTRNMNMPALSEIAGVKPSVIISVKRADGAEARYEQRADEDADEQ